MTIEFIHQIFIEEFIVADELRKHLQVDSLVPFADPGIGPMFCQGFYEDSTRWRVLVMGKHDNCNSPDKVGKVLYRLRGFCFLDGNTVRSM